MIKKDKFIENFATTFLATFVAVHHKENCLYDRHDNNLNPPFEEAFFLAEEVWKNMHGIDDNIDKYLEEEK